MLGLGRCSGGEIIEARHLFGGGGLLTVKMWAIVYSRWDVVEARFIPLKAIVVGPSCCGKFCSQNV